jgi:serine/threonine protein kinase, bacterial
MSSQIMNERNGHGNATFENEALLSDRYKLIKTLGAGGMGRTYIAEDTQRPGNPKCVVKQLKPIRNDAEFLETARRLFNSEAEMLEKLGNHDQIPRLLAYFEQNQEFYLVQELIDGQPLSAEMSPGEQWSETQVIQLLQEVSSILAFVQTHHVIHRDIKPDNIMRRYSDNKFVLIDFGAVKQVRMQQLTNTGQTSFTVAVGTPGYMPPEQSLGKPYLSSDIYALGMVAIQALTGLLPTQVREDANGELDWRKFAPEVSDGLATVLTKMVRRFHKQRYQSAMEALQALEELEANGENEGCPRTDVDSSAGKTPESKSTNQQSPASEVSEPLETMYNPQAAPKAQQPETLKSSSAPSHWAKKRYMQLGAGAAALSLCLTAGFGYSRTRDQANHQQQQAYQEIQNVKSLDECISKAEDFVKTSHSYYGMSFDNPEVRSDVLRLGDSCRHTREEQQHTLETLKQLQANGKFKDAIAQAKTFLQTKSEFTSDAQKILSESQLAYAQQLAKDGKYVDAIAAVTEISPDASVFKDAQRQIGEWADKILDIATDKYQNGKSDDFQLSLKIAGAVPKDSSAYNKAQALIQQWRKDEAKDTNNFQLGKAALNAQRWDDALAAGTELMKSPAQAWRKEAQSILDQANQGKQQETEPLNISNGLLDDTSQRLPANNSLYQEYKFEGKAGQTITISMESPDFMTQINLSTPSGQDMPVGWVRNGKNLSITATLTEAGTYRVRATATDAQGRGRYTLKAHVVS